MDSIGNFAESLIQDEVNNVITGKSAPPAPAGQQQLAPAGKDISNVQVPSSFRNQVLSESFNAQETPPSDGFPELVWDNPTDEKPKPVIIAEETAQELIPLLLEVRSLLTEMMSAGATMSGNIGVNMAGPQTGGGESWEQMEKSYGYKSAKAPTLPGDSRKKVLKQAIKNKLKNRKR